MNPLEYNGSGMVAMTGKNCVAIASDTRYGIRNQTIATNMKKIYKIHDKLFMGMNGLATDMQTVYERLKFRINMYELREERDIKPSSFANMVSNFLYERRFGPYFIEPIIAGLEGEENKPFITAQDLIGAPCYTDNFVCGGTCAEALFGMCESLYKPDMEADELFEVVSQCLLAAVDRDCISGWGAVVHVITPDKIITKNLRVRQD